MDRKSLCGWLGKLRVLGLKRERAGRSEQIERERKRERERDRDLES
jgi:hypothetical protein